VKVNEEGEGRGEEERCERGQILYTLKAT